MFYDFIDIISHITHISNLSLSISGVAYLIFRGIINIGKTGNMDGSNASGTTLIPQQNLLVPLPMNPANFIEFDHVFVGQDGPGGSGGSGNAPAIQSNHIMLIASFSRDGEPSVSSFLKNLEIVSRMGQWSGVQTLTVAKLKLTGRAEEYFNANPHLLTSYETFAAGLKQAFTNKISKFALERMFSSCTQGPMESVSQFALRLKGIANQLRDSYNNPDSEGTKQMMEERSLAQFISGLKPDLYRFVQVRGPGTLQQAEEYAMAEEANTRGYLTLHANEPPSQPQFQFPQNHVALPPPVMNPYNNIPGLQSQPNGNFYSLPRQGHSAHPAYIPAAAGCCNNIPYSPQYLANIPSVAPMQNQYQPNNFMSNTQTPQVFAAQVPTQTNRTDQVTNQARRRDLSITQCYNCNKKGHIARFCRSRGQTCYNCGNSQHTTKNCPLIICGLCNQNGHRPVDCPKNGENRGNGVTPTMGSGSQ